MKNDTPAVGYAFMLRVEGVHDIACRAVRGFRQEYEYDNIQEGGLNDYVHYIRKPISKPYTFTVERYVGIELADRMPIGTEFIAPLLLFVRGYGFSGSGTDPIVRTYAFTGAKVIGKDYGDLDAENSKLVVETTTIAYQEMMKINLPTDAFLKSPKSYKSRIDDMAKTKKDREKTAEIIKLLIEIIRKLLGLPPTSNTRPSMEEKLWELRKKREQTPKIYSPTYSELTANTLEQYAERKSNAQESTPFSDKISANNNNKKKPVKVKPYEDYIKQNIDSKEGREAVEEMAKFIAEIMNAMDGKPKEKSAHQQEIERLNAEWNELKRLAPVAFEELAKDAISKAKERAMAGGMSEEEADAGIANLQSLSIIPFVKLTANKRPYPKELTKEELLEQVRMPADKSKKKAVNNESTRVPFKELTAEKKSNPKELTKEEMLELVRMPSDKSKKPKSTK